MSTLEGQVVAVYLAEDKVLKGSHCSEYFLWFHLSRHYEAEVVRAIELLVVATHLQKDIGGREGWGLGWRDGRRNGEFLTFLLEQLVRMFSSRPPVSD